jgi:hypothetical protein
MKKQYLLFILFSLFSSLQAQVTIPIYTDVLFYDGYAGIVSAPTPPDVVRLRNDLFTKKLTQSVLSQIGNTLTLNISISAACDNYDRIGNINLALVPKDATSYVPENVSRIELGRIITPFMNKNVAPNLVPYTFSVDNVAKILKDSYINSQYDFWIEFELFGVPYAAQTQIAGCSGRNDVFFGTLTFETNTNSTVPNDTFLLPLNFKKNLNNYQAGATDAIGTTVRTINFNLANPVNTGKIYYIISNHGANSGGEEYNRRVHQIFFDSTSIIPTYSYTPGEETCEPYRVYNTQANGIYGSSPMTPAQWQSFSNWCPGAKIPIRVLNVNNLAAGNHFFRIKVPTAQFVNQEGYFPVSVYLQGINTVLNSEEFTSTTTDFYPNPTYDFINISSSVLINSIEILDLQGRTITFQNISINQFKYDMSALSSGIYLIKVNSDNGSVVEKIVKE